MDGSSSSIHFFSFRIKLFKMKKLSFSLCLIIGIAHLPSYAATSPLPNITEGTLSNGLKYTLVPLQGQQQRIDIRLLVKAGSLNEASDQLGVAHMLEHMVFHRSAKFTKGIAPTLQQQGWVRGKNYNAVTNFERTMYMLSPPKGSLQTEQGLNVLSQMVGYPAFTQQDLELERPIILEEWRGKLGVAERMNQQRIQALRANSRYPERPTIGTEASIRNTNVETIRQFHDVWYQPQNMQLMLIGDVDPKKIVPQIEQYFGSIPAKKLPLPENYDPQLSQQLRIVQLYDSESGSSQLSYVYRIDNKASKKLGKDGMRQRLLDQIASSVLTQQVQRQSVTMPSQISSMVMRKADIGEHTAAVGFFVNVLPDQHAEALPILLEEIARLKKYPIASKDIEQKKQDLISVAKTMLEKPEQREFEEWVQKLTINWQQERPYVGSWSVANDALEIIPTITEDEVNQRIQLWLNSSDQVLQYSVPGQDNYPLPSVDEVHELQADIERQPLQTLQQEQNTKLPKLAPVKKQGKIAKVYVDEKNQLQELFLSNGDRVVWMSTPLAQDKVYFTAESSAGFMAKGLNAWQTQIASQIIGQTGPRGWQASELSAWKTQHGISLNVSQKANELIISGQSSEKEFEQLLHLYHALQQQPEIEKQALKDSLASLMRRKAHSESSVSGQREAEVKQLRFNSSINLNPSLVELKKVSAKDLGAQWEKSTTAPVTYFILTKNTPSPQMKVSVEKYLAGIKRKQEFDLETYQAKSGQHEKTSMINIEPRAEIRAWSFTPIQWSPEEAVKVSITSNLAEKYLKNTLRDQELGIYRMKMNSTLNDQSQRIETEVSYTASPDRVNELWQKTQQTLQQLPELISDHDVLQQRQNFERSEAQRAQDIYTLQKRLQLSYKHYGDARYLLTMSDLSQAITANQIRETAAKLMNAENNALYITLPKTESAN